MLSRMTRSERERVARWLAILVGAGTGCGSSTPPARPDPTAHVAPADAGATGSVAADASGAEINKQLHCWLVNDPRCVKNAPLC